MTNLIKTFEPNLLGRDFVISDLHGSYSALAMMIDGLKFDPEIDRMFSVGDLVDRGEESLKCLELVREPWFHPVKANHEVMMLDAFSGGPTGFYWTMNGGMWGIEALNDANALELNDYRIPQDDSVALFDLLPIVEDLPYLITIKMKDGKKFHVIHAELPPNYMITDEDLEDSEILRQLISVQTIDGSFFTWGRYKFQQFYGECLDNVDKIARTVKYKYPNYKEQGEGLSHIISGHTIVQKPLTILGQTNIDTCAFDSWVKYEPHRYSSPKWCALTAVQLDTWKFYQATEHLFREVQPVTINKDVIDNLKGNQ